MERSLSTIWVLSLKKPYFRTAKGGKEKADNQYASFITSNINRNKSKTYRRLKINQKNPGTLIRRSKSSANLMSCVITKSKDQYGTVLLQRN